METSFVIPSRNPLHRGIIIVIAVYDEMGERAGRPLSQSSTSRDNHCYKILIESVVSSG